MRGDIYCIRHKTGFTGWAIRTFNRDKDPSFCDHIAVGGLNELLEHLPSGLAISPLDKYKDTSLYAVRIYRPMGFNPDDVEEMVDSAYKFVGSHYCRLAIACQGMDYLSNSRFFTERFAPKMWFVCSSYAAGIVTRNLGMAWLDVDKARAPLCIRSVRPDDIDDQLFLDDRWPMVLAWG